MIISLGLMTLVFYFTLIFVHVKLVLSFVQTIEINTKIKFDISKAADDFPLPQFPGKEISLVYVNFLNFCCNLFLGVGNKFTTRIVEAQLD